jgi:ketosteroid isomerase-like protein
MVVQYTQPWLCIQLIDTEVRMATEDPARSNLDLARRYLQILERDTSDPALLELFDPDFVFYEQPNRLNPNGRTLRAEELRALTAKAKQIILEQRYEVTNALAAGSEVAMEVEWTGRFNIGFASTPAGQPIRARLGIFLTFRAGKLVSQRNYDCYEPF